MKKTGKSIFFVVVLVIAGIAYLAFNGYSTRHVDMTKVYVKGAQDIRLGIDIRGGVDVTFSPPDGVDATDDEMSSAESVIKLRLLSQNITDSEVYTDFDKDRIIVRFPWKADEKDFNPEKAIAELGETAMLTFREDLKTDAEGKPTGITAEKIILVGKDIVSAHANPSQEVAGDYVVSLELTSDGAVKFAEATTRLAGTPVPISIWMDETVISYPTVNSAITDGKAVITGGFDAESAKDLADKINAGALPFKLQTENFNSISPTLGMGAFDAMVLAGLIAFALVGIIVISLYRLPGAVAMIALFGQVALMVAAITGFFPVFPSFTLTLPGIAGIILSIGFGVDANIITAERIKEEIRAGKTIDGSIDSGFKRAFTAIFDGNVTVIIVAIILMGSFGPPNTLFSQLLSPLFMWFGPSTAGAIYSFGYTLLTGVLLNLVMGVFASRIMLKSISKFKAFRNPVFYGGDKPKIAGDKIIDFTSKRKVYLGLSGAIIALTLVASIVMGVKLDIQFKGGSIITYSYTGSINKDEFKAAAEGVLGERVNIQEKSDALTGKMNFVLSLADDKGITSEKQMELSTTLETKYAENQIEPVSINVVDPVIGREFLLKCGIAVGFAAILMIIYIGFRFKKISGWSAGVMAVLALFHDVFIIFATFVFFGIPINDNFIAVVLTILGYSLNDTIVIYDRIRENKRLYGTKLSVAELMNKSVTQSLSRSIATTVTTMTAMAVVSVVAMIYNVDSILSFSFPLLVGMLSGVYSSICIAGPLWVWWQERKLAKKGI